MIHVIGRINEDFPWGGVFMQDHEGKKDCFAAGLKKIIMVIYSLHFIERRMEVQGGYKTCWDHPVSKCWARLEPQFSVPSTALHISVEADMWISVLFITALAFHLKPFAGYVTHCILGRYYLVKLGTWKCVLINPLKTQVLNVFTRKTTMETYQWPFQVIFYYYFKEKAILPVC